MIPLKPGALITSSLKMMECDRQTDHVLTHTTSTVTRDASRDRSDARPRRRSVGAAASKKRAAPARSGAALRLRGSPRAVGAAIASIYRVRKKESGRRCRDTGRIQ